MNVEPFYDSRYDAVVRWRYEAGIEIVMNAHWRVEPHYLRQEDSQSERRPRQAPTPAGMQTVTVRPPNRFW